MVFVPAGTTEIGSDTGTPDERPAFRVLVPAFFLDKTPVTVEQFRRFVDSTGFVTQAEEFGDGGALVGDAWTLVSGASWRHPLGTGHPAARHDHPVTQVSWNDAVAYCAYRGKRLPTEAEWEHAARGASNNRSRYAWGDELQHDHVHKANTWQGTFPIHNTVEDGFLLTSPVGAFGETSLGLTDIGGNVWEWTGDWYRPYGQDYAHFVPTATSERVQRGGSFLCNTSWCHGYRVSARGHSTPETSLFHVGFRCALSSDSTP
jgi:sulfatase modifying factor 1